MSRGRDGDVMMGIGVENPSGRYLGTNFYESQYKFSLPLICKTGTHLVSSLKVHFSPSSQASPSTGATKKGLNII